MRRAVRRLQGTLTSVTVFRSHLDRYLWETAGKADAM